MSNWSVGRKISAAAGVGTVCLMMIGIFAYTSALKPIATADSVTHTRNMMESGQAVWSLLKDAETGQNAYLMSGSQRDLGPVHSVAKGLGHMDRAFPSGGKSIDLGPRAAAHSADPELAPYED